MIGIYKRVMSNADKRYQFFGKLRQIQKPNQNISSFKQTCIYNSGDINLIQTR